MQSYIKSSTVLRVVIRSKGCSVEAELSLASISVLESCSAVFCMFLVEFVNTPNPKGFTEPPSPVRVLGRSDLLPSRTDPNLAAPPSDDIILPRDVRGRRFVEGMVLSTE